MKNLILLISLVYCFNCISATAQINLIEQYENGFTPDKENFKLSPKQSSDLTKSNNIVNNMNLNEEGMMSDLIKTAREFESLKDKQLKNIQGNREIIETLNYALEVIHDLVCNKMARGELSLHNVDKLTADC